MTTAELAPFSIMVTPDTPALPDVTVPDILKVADAVEVKLAAVASASLMVCALLVGLKAKPVLLGVIV